MAHPNDRGDGGYPVEYDPDTDTYRAQFDWTAGHKLSTTVWLALKTVAQKRVPIDGILYDYIDPDALDALFLGDRESRHTTIDHLSFTVEEYTVRIAGDGTIEIQPPTASD